MIDKEIIKKLYGIFTYDLSSNCHEVDHIEYAIYRLNGGDKDEEEWFLAQSEALN